MAQDFDSLLAALVTPEDARRPGRHVDNRAYTRRPSSTNRLPPVPTPKRLITIGAPLKRLTKATGAPSEPRWTRCKRPCKDGGGEAGLLGLRSENLIDHDSAVGPGARLQNKTP